MLPPWNRAGKAARDSLPPGRREALASPPFPITIRSGMPAIVGVRVRKRGQAGFTLVELMVSVTVIAILLAVATPSFSEFLERSRVRGAAEDGLALLAQARQGAVEADRNVRLTVSGTSGAWCLGAIQQPEPSTAGDLVSTTPAACNCSSNAAACLVGGEVLVADSDGSRGVTVSAGSLATDFTYDSKGGTLANLAATPQVDFISPRGHYTLRIEVNALGQARICNAGGRDIQGFETCS